MLIGSAKTNIGHLESAAGIAGLIKVVLSMQHGEIPPLLHLNEPSPYIPWDELPIDLPTDRTPWDPPSGRRVAGVSSFGFSGTNVHVVLESVASAGAGHRRRRPDRPLHVLTLSARTDTALRSTAATLAEQLEAQPELALADVAHTLAVGRADFAHRLAVVAGDRHDVATALAALRARASRPIVSSAPSCPGRVSPTSCSCSPATGRSTPTWAGSCTTTQPVFRAAIDRCAELLVPLMDRPLLDVLFDDERTLLDDMAYSQPALFAVEYALATLWQSWGVRPAAVAGHSVGEYVAAVVAGVMSLEDGLRLIAARGRLMGSLPPDGEMAAVLADRGAGRRRPSPRTGGRVSIAAVNGPESVAISGTGGALEAVVADLRLPASRCARLAIPIAAHSPQVDPILDAFEAVAATVTYSAPQLDVISGIAGRLAEGDDLQTPALLAETSARAGAVRRCAASRLRPGSARVRRDRPASDAARDGPPRAARRTSAPGSRRCAPVTTSGSRSCAVSPRSTRSAVTSTGRASTSRTHGNEWYCPRIRSNASGIGRSPEGRRVRNEERPAAMPSSGNGCTRRQSATSCSRRRWVPPGRRSSIITGSTGWPSCRLLRTSR